MQGDGCDCNREKDVIATETIEDTTYVSPSIDRDSTSLYVSA